MNVLLPVADFASKLVVIGLCESGAKWASVRIARRFATSESAERRLQKYSRRALFAAGLCGLAVVDGFVLSPKV